MQQHVLQHIAFTQRLMSPAFSLLLASLSSGGLVSVVYADVVQSITGERSERLLKKQPGDDLMSHAQPTDFARFHDNDVMRVAGIFGLIVCAAYMLQNRPVHAPPPSIGYPGYVYPNAEVCAMYEGVPSSINPGTCVYNEVSTRLNAFEWCFRAYNAMSVPQAVSALVILATHAHVRHSMPS